MVTTATRYQFSADALRRVAALGIAADPAHHFTSDEYQALSEAGILTPDDHVELIEGVIVTMAAMGGPHVRCMARLMQILGRAVPRDLFVNPQCAIRLTDDSEPEPDIAVVRDWDFARTLPRPADILFLIEVGDATIKDDRDDKLPRYARAGIVEAWLVDVKAGTLERHTEPRNGRYQQVVTARVGESPASTTVPEVIIPVADILR